MNHNPHGLRTPGNGLWHFENNVMNLLQIRLGSGTIISKPVSHGRLQELEEQPRARGALGRCGVCVPPPRDLLEQPQEGCGMWLWLNQPRFPRERRAVISRTGTEELK